MCNRENNYSGFNLCTIEILISRILICIIEIAISLTLI